MLKIIVAIVVLLSAMLAGLLAVAATKPDIFRVQRMANIKAEPEKIFALINDLHAWVAWSPYEQKDPAMRRTYSGAASGKGAAYEWDGDSNVGKGRMEITDTSVPSKITIKLDFMRPIEGHNMVDFTLKPQGGSTNVTWDMHGPSPLIGKVIGLLIDMDRMVGKDFEDGLNNLKILAEK